MSYRPDNWEEIKDTALHGIGKAVTTRQLKAVLENMAEALIEALKKEGTYSPRLGPQDPGVWTIHIPDTREEGK